MSRSMNDATIDDDLVSGFASLDLNPPQYSHDIAVKAITSFYEFINRMHPDGSARIEYPPSTGWPQITARTHPPCSAVIELLRHIPYLTDCSHIMNDTESVNYIDHLYSEIEAQDEDNTIPSETHDLDQTSCSGAEDRSNNDIEYDSDDDPDDWTPPHIVELASGIDLYGYSILLDTEDGVIYWCVMDGHHLPVGLPPGDANSFEKDDEVEHSENNWKIMPAWRIETFFQMCKEQFRILNWYPYMEADPYAKVGQLQKHQVFDRWEEKRAQIMKDCGWPGDGEGRNWDKARAERETREWRLLEQGR